jgi:7,8-dihydropterin-6-yl-methyl-4-(beta-D-ribofuranosyl)aminobenzene 5'-phosphate synthase
VLITGEVDRVTSFEKGFPTHQAWRATGWDPDPLILDDQALIVHVAGRGLVVLTGCGHAGVINICRYAQHLTGIGQLHAVIGGFHLTRPLFEPIITVCESVPRARQEECPRAVTVAHRQSVKILAGHAVSRQ